MRRERLIFFKEVKRVFEHVTFLSEVLVLADTVDREASVMRRQSHRTSFSHKHEGPSK